MSESILLPPVSFAREKSFDVCCSTTGSSLPRNTSSFLPSAILPATSPGVPVSWKALGIIWPVLMEKSMLSAVYFRLACWNKFGFMPSMTVEICPICMNQVKVRVLSRNVFSQTVVLYPTLTYQSQAIGQNICWNDTRRLNRCHKLVFDDGKNCPPTLLENCRIGT